MWLGKYSLSYNSYKRLYFLMKYMEIISDVEKKLCFLHMEKISDVEKKIEKLVR